MLCYDRTAISRARKLQAEARALRLQRALIQCTRGKRAFRGLSPSMLMELAHDLAAIGFHDLSQLCRATAEATGGRQ